MANTLTSLIPDAYAALDVVSRELVGLIPAVARDSRADRIAVGQTLRVPVTPANASGADITAAMSLPTIANQVIANKTLTITKARFTSFSWNGEEQRGMNAGPGYLTLQQDQIAQAMRALANEIEVDLAVAAALGASRAFGTAGTTPFGTTVGDVAQLRKILDDNGAPQSDRHLVINTSAGLALRSLPNLIKINEAGSDTLLRQGSLNDNISGFMLRETAQIQTPAAGTGAAYVLNGVHAVGATNVVVKTGAGTVLAGDVLTINGFKYVVNTGVGAPGTVVIAAPGLRSAGADGDAVTVNAAAARNLAFSRNALLLANRLPAIPEEGDQASDRQTIVDPRSGIPFELAVYPGFRMNTYFIGTAWGTLVIKPEHLAALLG